MSPRARCPRRLRALLPLRRLGGIALGLLLVGAAPAAPPAPSAARPPAWDEVERAVEEDRLRAALAEVEAIRTAAEAAGDEMEQARALVRAAQLRSGLGEIEATVTRLRQAPWPEAPVPNLVARLVYARSLATYFEAHVWEISRRERTVADGELDLATATLDQILDEADRVLAEAWTSRDRWGEVEVGALGDYFVTPNDFPPRIRGTLRDAVTYLRVELLSLRTTWGWAVAGGFGSRDPLGRFDLATLIDGGPEVLPPVVEPGDPSAPAAGDPPLARGAALLADLEAWHVGRGEPEAAFEARHARLESLWRAVSGRPAQDALRAALGRALNALGSEHPWWSRGQATLAAWTDAGPAPDARIRARELALEAARRYPDSFGACAGRRVASAIEAQELELETMTSDGPGERSILVRHRNLARLWFRAYAFDLVRFVEGARDWNLLPDSRDLSLPDPDRPPAAEWSVELPATADYRSHNTFVVPRVPAPGLYLVVASARRDFVEADNQLAAVRLIVTDLVLLTRQEGRTLHVTALSGATGAPRPGARIDLYRTDWERGHRRVAAAVAGPDGEVELDLEPDSQQYFVLGEDGGGVAIDPSYVTSRGRRPPEETASLVYTDRAVYRPGQELLWKVMLYRGGREEGRFRTLPATGLTVRLLDPNRQVVAEEEVTTNGFGSVSGRFEVPHGRPLGTWSVQTSPGGAASVQVEEYRRPTFEVLLEAPGEALRFGRPAVLAGEARYYFGQPVSGGAVDWRVTREPVFGAWWQSARGGAPAGSEVVAAGAADLEAGGRFEVAFTPDRADPGGDGPVVYGFRLEATVTAEGGETREAARVFRIGSVAAQVRLEDDAGFYRAGEPVALSAVLADLEGTPLAGSGRWRLVRVAPPERTLLPAEIPETLPGADERFSTPGDRLRPRWSTEPGPQVADWPEGEQVAAGPAVHGDDGRAPLSLGPLPAGAYRLLYATEDGSGRRVESRRNLLVVGAADGTETLDLPVPALLRAERATVEPGGTVRVLVHSGLPDQDLYLDVRRRGRPTERLRLSSTGGPRVLEVPAGPDARGGIAFDLVGVRDHQLIQASETVAVPWSDRELALELATFRDRLRPGSHEEWRVTVRGADGEALAAGAAEVLASMYDRSLDLVAPHRPPSVLGRYPVLPVVRQLATSLGHEWQVWAQRSSRGDERGCRSPEGERFGLVDPLSIQGTSGQPLAVNGVFITDMAAIRSIPTARDPWNVVTQTPGVLSDRINVGGNEIGQFYAFDQSEEIEGLPAPGRSAGGLRTDFAETAFFEPHLLTGADGSVAFAFTVPDSVTEWNLWVQAVTRDLRSGSTEARARTVKDLLVRPYLPRFLRAGDHAQVRIAIDNAGDEPLRGTLQVDLLDPESGVSRNADFGLAPGTTRELPFEVAPGAGTTLTVPLTVPPGLGAVAFRATARAGEWSDGEQRPLPILPARVHLAQSRSAALHGPGRATLRFPALLAADEDPTLDSDQLVVTLDARLFDALLGALPYLVEYPYGCTEQTLNRFVSTAVVSSFLGRHPEVAARARSLAAAGAPPPAWDEDDPNRAIALVETPWLRAARRAAEGDPLWILDPRVAANRRAAALERLRASQTAIGGFPWFPGGPPSPYITLYLLQGFSRVIGAGVEVPRETVAAAWRYMHRHALDELLRASDGPDDPACCWTPTATYLAYVLSGYSQASLADWTGGVFTAEDRGRLLDLAFARRREHSHLQKAQLALALHLAGRAADARLVFESLMDAARTSDDLGTAWTGEERTWLWYQDPVETHAYALEAMNELAPDDPRRHGVVQWLLLDRRLGHWQSTRASAEAVYALVDYLGGEPDLATSEAATVAVGPVTRSFAFAPDEPPGEAARVVIPGDEVTPAMGEVAVEKGTPGFLFAIATWHLSTERPPAAGDGDLLAVERSYFRRVRSDRGAGTPVLEPLADDTPLAVGDEVEVRLSIRARHAAEYVHLRDPRGAGFEPETLTSGYRWDGELPRYEEVRDSGIDLFFERLPAGEHVLRYRLRAATAGTFHVAPAVLESLYAPALTAYSAGDVLRVASRRGGPGGEPSTRNAGQPRRAVAGRNTGRPPA